MKFKAIAYFVLVFFAGALTSSVFEWLTPITTIEVTNASNKVIKQLDIKYRGMGEHEGLIAENLKPGQIVTFKWATEGEASYRLHAIFEEGTEVKGGAGYIQRGDTIKELIELQRVMTRLPMAFTFGSQHGDLFETTSSAGD